MPSTTRDDIIIADIFTEAVQAAFEGGVVALWGTAVAAINDSFGGDANMIGELVKVPYFSSIGEFQDVEKDGEPLEPQEVAQTQELAEVRHAGLAFKPTRWSRSSVGGDVYTEGARQMLASAQRKADKLLIDTACDLTQPGLLLRDAFREDKSHTLDWDLLVEGKMLWGDEQEDVALMVVSSKTLGDLYKLKTREGRPLLIDSVQDGGLPRLMGIPVGTSDRMPVDGSEMGAVTATGTAPPDVTVTGAPTRALDLRIEIVAAGPLGTATFRFSTDQGATFSALRPTAPSVVLGDTGLTAHFAQAPYASDNAYTAEAVLRQTTLMMKRGSLAYWYNRAALTLQTWRDILSDADVAAMHLYHVTHRYRRMPARRKPGVVAIRHR